MLPPRAHTNYGAAYLWYRRCNTVQASGSGSGPVGVRARVHALCALPRAGNTVRTCTVGAWEVRRTQGEVVRSFVWRADSPLSA
jgi:hypothetical protein